MQLLEKSIDILHLNVMFVHNTVVKQLTHVSAIFRFTSDSCRKKLILTKETLGGSYGTAWAFMLSTFNLFVFL